MNLFWVSIIGFGAILLVVTNEANKIIAEIKAVQKQLSNIEQEIDRAN
jgi:hypothetical protein